MSLLHLVKTNCVLLERTLSIDAPHTTERGRRRHSIATIWSWKSVRSHVLINAAVIAAVDGTTATIEIVVDSKNGQTKKQKKESVAVVAAGGIDINVMNKCSKRGAAHIATETVERALLWTVLRKTSRQRATRATKQSRRGRRLAHTMRKMRDWTTRNTKNSINDNKQAREQTAATTTSTIGEEMAQKDDLAAVAVVDCVRQ
jgi:hypothetical protein